MGSKALNKLSRHVLRQALDCLPVPTAIIDAEAPDRPVVYANPALARQAGYAVGEILGRPFEALAAEPPAFGGAEPWLLRCRGGATLELQAAALYEHPGRPAYWILRGASPAVAEPRPVASFEPAATGTFTATGTWSRPSRDERVDPVTGIPARAAFLETLARDQALASRDGHALSVIVLRVDALESYHAIFGRHATDACIRKVGHSIVNSLRRAADYCARVGHDRFAVLIAGAGERKVQEFAEEIARRVRDLAIHHPRAALNRYVTVSPGIASLGRTDAHSAELDLLERAERDVEIRASMPVAGRAGPEAGIA